MAEKVIILGSGPAGLTAALYAARADLEPLVLEGGQPGGQLTTTTEVENYPGFVEGIDGTKLVDAMREQAKRFGARFEYGRVVECDLSQRPLTIGVADPFDTSDEAKAQKQLETQTLIIGTGASARYLGLASERRLLNKGVSACAVCDGALPIFRNATLAVVGGGDSACEEALYLTKFASKVYMVHRRDQLRASTIMASRVEKHEKIEVLWNSVIEDVLGDEKVEGMRVKDVKTGATRDVELGGFFLAIGHDPNTKFLKGQLKLDAQGFIEVEHPSARTSAAGVFACGDVMDPHYKQAITAAGSGCRAALDAEAYLESLAD
ncbi:thioredoxin-disulfide reductase [Candidatus Sumerlaeota bacterium]|nr:thioredoxin-disulfide reductase [Candidatus Sumerlaeota bacterium]